MAGTKNLKELVLFVIELAEGIVKSLEDDKVTITDAVNLVPAVKAALPAFEGISDVGQEFADLDDEEQLEIIEYVKSEFDLAEKEVEAFIESAFATAMNLVELVQDGIELFSKEEDPE